MRLKGKIAVVTGGAGGIGAATCVRFAQEGADLAVIDVKEKGAEATAARVRDLGRKAAVIVADVSRREDVQRLFAQVLERFGTIDILVNNAGVITWGSILELPEEDWDRVLRVNLKSMYLCTQEAARYWVKAQKRGKIVNLGSVNSDFGVAGLTHYCASKGGVKMFTKAAALDLAPYKINVNAVAPGGTLTDFTPQLKSPENLERAKLVPWGRAGQPEDMASVILFLVSDDAEYITGEMILVTGGKTAKY